MFACPKPSDADLLWGAGFLATAPLEDSWTFTHAEKFAGANIIVLGLNPSTSHLKRQAKSCVNILMPSVSDWFAGLSEPKAEALKAFCEAARHGTLANGNAKPEEKPETSAPAKTEPKVITLTPAEATAIVTKMKMFAAQLKAASEWLDKAADKIASKGN